MIDRIFRGMPKLVFDANTGEYIFRKPTYEEISKDMFLDGFENVRWEEYLFPRDCNTFVIPVQKPFHYINPGDTTDECFDRVCVENTFDNGARHMYDYMNELLNERDMEIARLKKVIEIQTAAIDNLQARDR